MWARYYSPEIRRFISEDVILEFVARGQLLNRFAFVMGNPVSFVDPEGLYMVIAVDPTAVGGLGHTLILIPQGKDIWLRVDYMAIGKHKYEC